MHIGAIDEGSTYEIEVRVSEGGKRAALALFWTAPAETKGTRPVVEVIAPGASKLLRGNVPVGALRLVVDLDLEDDGGTTVQARVTQVGGGLSFQGAFTGDVRLAAVVV